jgi:acetyl esterase/lipase
MVNQLRRTGRPESTCKNVTQSVLIAAQGSDTAWVCSHAHAPPSVWQRTKQSEYMSTASSDCLSLGAGANKYRPPSGIKYGDPKTQADLLRRLSPINKIERVKAATIVLHGANDTNVPVVEAEQVVDNLKKRGVPVELVMFADEGHGWRKTPNRIRSTIEVTRWFVKYLGQDKVAN